MPILLVRYTGPDRLSGGRGCERHYRPDVRDGWLNAVQAISKGERVGVRLVYETDAIQ